jgi:hypothetical protein
MNFSTANKNYKSYFMVCIILAVFILSVTSPVVSQEDHGIYQVSEPARAAEDIYVQFSSQLEQHPSQAIEMMVSAITVNPDYACLIIKTILGFVPAQKVGEVVLAAIKAAPEQLATIINCAVSAVPEEILAIVRAGIIAAPDRVGVVVSAAVDAAPTLAAEVVQAAIGAAPGEVVDIVTAAVEAAPQEAANIVAAAIAAAPEQATDIVAAAVAAAPAFSSEIVQAALDAAATVDGGLATTINLGTDTPLLPRPFVGGSGGSGGIGGGGGFGGFDGDPTIGSDRPGDAPITSAPPSASGSQ